MRWWYEMIIWDDDTRRLWLPYSIIDFKNVSWEGDRNPVSLELISVEPSPLAYRTELDDDWENECLYKFNEDDGDKDVLLYNILYPSKLDIIPRRIVNITNIFAWQYIINELSMVD